jgi:broad specificity phosphatase PhoE
MTRCYLVRHAQTAWNEENRIQGRSDQPLNAAGRAQAERLARRFAAHHVTGLFTSHLVRSRSTAEVIATPPSAGQAGNGHPISVVVEPDLAEMHLGAWEGLTPAEVDARFASAYQQWRQQPSSVLIPEAEPVDAFRQRVRQVFGRLTARMGEGEYVVVSHGGVIAAILADVLGADYDHLLRRLRLDNAGVTAIELDAPMPHVLWVNSTTHLEPGPPIPSTWF